LLVAFREGLQERGSDVLIFISMDKHTYRNFTLDLTQCGQTRDKVFVESYVECPRDVHHGDEVIIPPCGYLFFKAK
jgi:hypothetical protein